jgi:hypothetical protein
MARAPALTKTCPEPIYRVTRHQRVKEQSDRNYSTELKNPHLFDRAMNEFKGATRHCSPTNIDTRSNFRLRIKNCYVSLIEPALCLQESLKAVSHLDVYRSRQH